MFPLGNSQGQSTRVHLLCRFIHSPSNEIRNFKCKIRETRFILTTGYLKRDISSERNLLSSHVYSRQPLSPFASCFVDMAFRDIVSEKLLPNLLSAFPIGPRSIIHTSSITHWRTSYSACLGIFNLEDGIFIRSLPS